MNSEFLQHLQSGISFALQIHQGYHLASDTNENFVRGSMLKVCREKPNVSRTKEP